ncbi:hypothetical protein Osc7112_5036 [Oscillatoria nigro-viridis PCC 7112]|uniref:DUF5678 domain-containing protein n=1 Tax=Phormidium nigroviride PCC 7112 TaxID=179408 RepID=K9VP85_9CYAN|nr:DUF5678 domain-containing protein [Oscillatoria nigro-viridis]AFZ09302.1 hypothetical protein Osc7112_5036 [Oscillatoria nigro-viridis PCC 7112]
MAHSQPTDVIRFISQSIYCHNADRLIAHSENLQEVLALAEASGEIFAIYLVPRRCASVRILPIRSLPESQATGP